MNDQWSEPGFPIVGPRPDRQEILSSVAHRVTFLVLIAIAVLALWTLSSRPEPIKEFGPSGLPTGADFARSASVSGGD